MKRWWIVSWSVGLVACGSVTGTWDASRGGPSDVPSTWSSPDATNTETAVLPDAGPVTVDVVGVDAGPPATDARPAVDATSSDSALPDVVLLDDGVDAGSSLTLECRAACTQVQACFALDGCALDHIDCTDPCQAACLASGTACSSYQPGGPCCDASRCAAAPLSMQGRPSMRAHPSTWSRPRMRHRPSRPARRAG